MMTANATAPLVTMSESISKLAVSKFGPIPA